ILALVFFGGWFAIGFGSPTSSDLAYFFNGASRISSQVAISVAVYAPPIGNSSQLRRIVLTLQNMIRNKSASARKERLAVGKGLWP
ncbi:MAG: hypothetical protein ACRECH_16680, partial [Nitrososphaerales archaeon]